MLTILQQTIVNQNGTSIFRFTNTTIREPLLLGMYLLPDLPVICMQICIIDKL